MGHTQDTIQRGAALNAPHLCPQSPWGAAILDSAWCPHLWSLSARRASHWLPAALPSPSPSHADALRPVLTSLAPAHPFPSSAFGLTTWVFQIRRCRLFSCVLLRGPRAGPGGGVLRTYVSFVHRADMCSTIPQASLTYRNQ